MGFYAQSSSSWVTDVIDGKPVIEALWFQPAENNHAVLQELMVSSLLECRRHPLRWDSFPQCRGFFQLMHASQRCSCWLFLEIHTLLFKLCWLSFWLINVYHPIYPKIISNWSCFAHFNFWVVLSWVEMGITSSLTERHILNTLLPVSLHPTHNDSCWNAAKLEIQQGANIKY